MKKYSGRFLKWILKQFAAVIVWRFEPQIIAVTGSVGKILTLEAIHAVLGYENTRLEKRRVRTSRGGLGSLTVPLAVIGSWSDKELSLLGGKGVSLTGKARRVIFWLKVVFAGLWNVFFSRKSAYPEILILEYGSRMPGDVKYSLEIARPDIGIITALGEVPAHVEFWSGPEAIAKEKSKIVEYLPSSGFAILNYDDETIMKFKERTRGRVVTFGFGEGADVRITNLENKEEEGRPVGISLKMSYGGSVVPVHLRGAFGKSHVYAAAAAACVGLIFDLNLVEISEALQANYRAPRGAMRLIKGVKDTYIIDGSSGASPLSVHEALHTLRDLPGTRKIAVLGDMLELGKYSIEAHEAVGELAGKVADVLLTVGPRGKFIASGAEVGGLSKHKIYTCDTSTEAGRTLQDLMRKGDLVLIKGAKEIGLDKVVEEVRAMQVAPIV